MQQTLGLLREFDLGELRSEPVRAMHLVAEASRLAFADRNLYLGDPSFVAVPVSALLSSDYLAARAALIDPSQALRAVAPGTPSPVIAWEFAPSSPAERPSTSHFSIADSFGDAVAMTTSVQGAFGSQLMVGGFILNNQLTDFSFQPEENGRPIANRPDSGKRPLSSMTPTFVVDSDDRLRVIVGSPGGTRIINFVAQAVIGVLDWGLNIQPAVAAPHFVAQEGFVELEEGTAILEHTDALQALGHRAGARNLNSGLHGIEIQYTDSGRILWGGVDPRREGAALGD
jgi:gamma-glutamyltranspeptidase/glutathione hydrolase